MNESFFRYIFKVPQIYEKGNDITGQQGQETKEIAFCGQIPTQSHPVGMIRQQHKATGKGLKYTIKLNYDGQRSKFRRSTAKSTVYNYRIFYIVPFYCLL